MLASEVPKATRMRTDGSMSLSAGSVNKGWHDDNPAAKVQGSPKDTGNTVGQDQNSDARRGLQKICHPSCNPCANRSRKANGHVSGLVAR